VFKTMILLQRRGDMSEEDFQKYWRNVHGPLATRLPGLRRYVQNVITYYSDTTSGYNGVAEMWFDDIESMRKAFESEVGQETRKDLEKFVGKYTTIFADEYIVLSRS